MAQDDPYAKIAKPVDDPYAAIAKPVATEDTRSFLQRGIDNFNANTQGAQPGDGLVKGFLNNVGQGGGNAVRAIANTVAHPIDSLHNEVDAVRGTIAHPSTLLDQAHKEVDAARSDPSRFIGNAVGNMAVQAVAGEGAGRALGTLPAIPGLAAKVVRAPFVKAADEVIPGTSLTPRARYNAAQRVGVNLDLADATNSTPATMLKAINRDSLAGSGVYDKAKAANIAALGNSTDSTLRAMSPLDREAGGVRLQGLLKENQQALKDAAQSKYEAIQSQYGNRPVANPFTLSSVGSDIQAADQTHAAQFPSLQPSRVDAVVSDAANFGKVNPIPVKPSGLVDESGASIPSTSQPSPAAAPTVADALKARSGVLDLYQNNPELIKGAADAKLQRLVGAADDTVMDSLPPDAQETLRSANATWKDLKSTYDNPSSSLYDAVRTPNPTSKVAGIGPDTPESVRGIISRVGPEGTGILQRGRAEKLLGTAPGTEEYNFRSFPQQFSKLPQDYGKELFGDKRLGELRDISDTSHALSRDLNPSGTAKQGQKLAEAAALIPTFGAPLLQYPLARAMNSPGLVKFIMKEPSLAAAAPLRFPVPLIGSRKNGTR